MEDKYVIRQGRKLRCGYTTGTCAQAAAGAAARGFFTGQIPAVYEVTTPDGTVLTLSVEDAARGIDPRDGRPFAVCAVRKDAGDDVDVTDGMLVYAKVTAKVAARAESLENKESPDGKNADPKETKDIDPEGKEDIGPEGKENSDPEGKEDTVPEGKEDIDPGGKEDIDPGGNEAAGLVKIVGGIGVGRVTKPGLDQPVGAAAINSTPRRMIREEVLRVMEEIGEEVPLSVEIFLPDGEERAGKTMNARLGIVGGLSILGTTGIVEPMSEQALVDTIRAELSMRHALGQTDLLLTPGNYGKKFIADSPEFEEENAVKCSNFIGDSLDLAVEYGFRRVTLVGHIGKLVKLAGGMMNTHSAYGDCRMELLAACGLQAGVSAECLKSMLDCVTCDDAIRILLAGGNACEPVMKLLGEKILYHMNARCRGRLKLRVVVFSNVYGVLADMERPAQKDEILK